MSDLAKKILTLFRGRHDHIAVADGTTFAPAKESPSEPLISDHLAGKRSFGFYVMTADNRVHCTCVDFDNKPERPNPEYENQAVTLYAALRSFDLKPLLERSQSGSGYHVWLFFSAPVEAYVVRAWWRGVERRLAVKFVEVFPKQDKHIGSKGLGNLVRYPLWNKSAFIDPEDDMRVLDAGEALDGVQKLATEDLPLLAFQLGMGPLKADVSAQVVVAGGADGMLPLRVQKHLESSSSLLARRWNGDTSGMKDTSNSAVAMSIARELVRRYTPTPEVESALAYWCRLRNVDKGEREDWVKMTALKAYDFLVTREEKTSETDSTFEKSALAYIDSLERGDAICLPSGMTELDRSIDGAGIGEMVIIAARPGQGKSAFAFQWLQNVAGRGKPGLLVSEEMSAIEIGKRRLLTVTNLPQEHWGASTAKQLRQQVAKYHEGSAPVHIVEGCNTIDRVEEVIEQFVSVHGIGIAAVDYLQLLTGRTADRYEIVTEMSRRLKQCARRNHIPILVLSQLNRAVENRQDNEPKLSDLRESGGIEQDADMVLFLQWPFKFDPQVNPDEYRIICAKRRNGPIRQPRVVTVFNPSRQIIGRDSDIPYRGE